MTVPVRAVPAYSFKLTEALDWMLIVPVPAFAVTVPETATVPALETGCVTPLPSTRKAPAVVRENGSVLPVV